ncbi:MAG: type III pantothenate kinase [Chloroflexota bacterium]|nr:type III pantothenate kinase [Chloroflexota bacterium]
MLLFDISNTHITLGAYRGDELVSTWRITTRVDGTADEYAALLRSLLKQKGANGITFDGCAISSSVPPLVSTFDELCQRYLKLEPIIVGPGVKTGLNIRTDSPREVGADRIANAVAVKKLYGTPAIVIDFSATATIFDALSDMGDYIGTAIAPGVTTSADALFTHAAQLPRIELVAPASRSAIGKNTVSAVQAGLIYGYVALVEGMIARQKQELGTRARVIGTGEMVQLIAAETKAIDVVDECLTLKGLKMIYEMNAG